MKEFEVYTNTAEKLEQNRRRRKIYQKYRMFLSVAIAFILLLSMVAYHYRDFKSYESVRTISDESGNKKNIELYLDGIVKYNSKGIVYYKENGERVWNCDISMKNPIVEVCQSYMIVYEKKGSHIYVIDEKGKSTQVITAYGIEEAEVTKNGLVAVVLNNKDTNYIDIYNRKGESLVNSKMTLDGQGYPLDMDITSTGELLCASNFVLQGVTKKDQINFYDYSEKGRRTENIMATFEYEDTLVPTVAFLGDDTLCAFGDNKISVYNINGKPFLKKQIDLDVTVKSIAYDDEHFAIIRDHKGDETEGNYTMEIFSRNGNCIGEAGIEDEYSQFQLYGERILLNSAYQCKIYTLSGKKIFDYTFKSRIVHFLPTQKNGQYYISHEDKIDIIKLK